MKKVLFIASTASHLKNFHVPYLKRFQETGRAVHAACGGPPEEIPGADRTITLPFRKSMTAPENFQAARVLREMIKSENYSLISMHTSLAAFFARLSLSGIKNRPPVVNMVHGYLFDRETPFARRMPLLAAERWMASRTDLVLVMNACDQSLASQYRLGREIRKIPGVGVDFSRLERAAPEDGAALRKKYRISEGAFVVLYPAEFSRRKNQAVLIRALARLPEEVILVLTGEGATFRQCRALAKELGLAGRVRFPGHSENMGAWYRAADAAASGSLSEGLPFNVMEAMYMGLPVAASAVKGHTDLIRPGESGILYPRDDARACAKAIQTLLESPSLRKELGERARADVESYRLERVFPLVMKCYEDFLTA